MCYGPLYWFQQGLELAEQVLPKLDSQVLNFVPSHPPEANIRFVFEAFDYFSILENRKQLAVTASSYLSRAALT
jgi:hypothetical protein